MNSTPISHRSSLKALFVASAVLCASPLLAQNVSTDYDHKADFSKYHTFSITHLQASNSFIEQRLRDDLVKALTAHGLQMVPQGGELDVTAVGSRKNQQEYNTFYDGLGGGGYGWGGRGFGRRFGGGFGGFGEDGESNTSVINIPVGNLVVDLYGGSDHQLLFRGIATDSLSTNENKNSKKLEQAVNKVFKKYPPKES